jgi:hypothetical protein
MDRGISRARISRPVTIILNRTESRNVRFWGISGISVSVRSGVMALLLG